MSKMNLIQNTSRMNIIHKHYEWLSKFEITGKVFQQSFIMF